MDIKISVVVPVYNVENYLEKCLRSIINQSYINWEAFLVVDGATDNSLEICKKIEKEDSRFCVLTKENGGLASARNYALPFITGEYIAFVDSDDYLEQDYLQKLLQGAVKNGADISMCGYIYEDEEGNELYQINKRSRSYSREDIIKEMYIPLNRSWGSFVWNKLYNTQIIKENNLSFNEELKVFEDILFNYQYLKFVKTGYFSSDSLYHYLKRNTSLINNVMTDSPKQKYLYYTKSFDAILEDSKDKDMLFFEQARVMKCIHTATALRVLANLNLEKHPRYIIEKRYLKRNIFILLKNSDIPLKKRLGAVITLLFPKKAYRIWSKQR